MLLIIIVNVIFVTMTNWCPDLSTFDGPRYLAIAAALEADRAEDRLTAGDRLPTHRDLAWRLSRDVLAALDQVVALAPLVTAAGATDEPTAHSHLDNDLPTATDVAMVMIWPTLAPHLVLTPHHIFRIDADGTIGYLDPNESLDAEAGGVE